MLRENMDISPYITASDFDANRCTNGLLANYQDVGLFENYDLAAISADGLERAAGVYCCAIIAAQKNDLDISALFEKYGQIGAIWRGEFPNEDNIPDDIKAAFFAYNITAARARKDYRAYADETRRFVDACPVFAPIMRSYQESMEKEIGSEPTEPDEFAQLAAQVKENIRDMINAGALSEAESTLAELEGLCPDDPEIEELRAVINARIAGE